MREEKKTSEMLPVDHRLTTTLEMLGKKNRNVRKPFDIGRGALPVVVIEPDSTLLFE